MVQETVLLKISGESLSGQGKFGISRQPLEFMVSEIRSAREALDFRLAIVIGGGNILRGADLKKNVFRKDTFRADNMGMLATMMNGIAFREMLEQYEIENEMMSALRCDGVSGPYYPEKALSHLKKGRVVILAGGNGAPYQSTDMTMVLRAKELGAKTVLKGTKVDGIYTANPVTDENAVFISRISFDKYLSLAMSTNSMKIVDFEAVGFARTNQISIRVFNFFKEGNLRRILLGEDIGSVIH